MECVKCIRRRGVPIGNKRILISSPFQAEADRMAASYPANVVGGYQAVRNVAVEATGAEPCIANGTIAGTVEAKLRKDQTVSVPDAEFGRPICAVHTVRFARIIETVETYREGI